MSSSKHNGLLPLENWRLIWLWTNLKVVMMFTYKYNKVDVILNGLLSFLNVAKHPPMPLNPVTSKKRVCLHVCRNKLLSHIPGKMWYGEVWQHFIQEDLLLFPRRLFRGTEKGLSMSVPYCFSCFTVSLSHVRPIMFTQKSAWGVMCLEVERGAASWPFVIRVMWDPYDESVWVRWEGWWVYMGYWSFLWPLMVRKKDFRWFSLSSPARCWVSKTSTNCTSGLKLVASSKCNFYSCCM